MKRWWKSEWSWSGDTSHLPCCLDLTEKLQLMLQLQKKDNTEQVSGVSIITPLMAPQLNMPQSSTHGCLPGLSRHTKTHSPQSLDLGRNQCSIQHHP